ncbi:hypothetical protein J6524_29495 [Bradyrhizobium sp. WSM 1738]|uniref:hypothetical protein n=1 Tax=Bradyrhizobium hereditatis TaxID=2821405 RepID=UPI001CE33436|nr:hypothetical protein [Bradyrhizobium hereditatis]MCA6118984.1 hypothetical protein [Bradyrhizobium hereditatis]
MSEISIQQVRALALDVLHSVDRLANSVDELLLEMRATNRVASETERFCEMARQLKAVSE